MTTKRKLTPRTKTPQVQLPAGPFIERVPTGHKGAPRVVVLPAGLALIEHLAAQGGSQPVIAARLSLGLVTFKKLLNVESESEPRLAWERGRSEAEFTLAKILLQQAKDGNCVAAIWLTKQHGWSETPVAASNAPNITIVLPDSRSPEDYMRTINAIEAPPAIEFDPTKTTRPIVR